jgi:hypothetical protein
MHRSFYTLFALMIACATPTVYAGDPPGPADDELFFNSFEFMGLMTESPSNSGIVVPADGLPVLLQDDDGYYLAKCSRLDCATGVARDFVASTDNIRRSFFRLGSDGMPNLLYWDQDENEVRLDRCLDMTCATRSTQTVFDGSAGEMAFAPGPDGNPRVALISGTSGLTNPLLYITCETLDCSMTSAPITLDSGSFKSKVSMGFNASDLPVVAFTNLGAGAPEDRQIRVITCDSINSKYGLIVSICLPSPDNQNPCIRLP